MPRYLPHEIEFIERNYKTLTRRQIAAKLHRPYENVRCFMKNNGYACYEMTMYARFLNRKKIEAKLKPSYKHIENIKEVTPIEQKEAAAEELFALVSLNYTGCMIDSVKHRINHLSNIVHA